MAKSPRILTFKRSTTEEKRESVRRQVAAVLPAPRVAPDGERRLDEELVDSVLARHPSLTREEAIEELLKAGA